MEIRWDTLTRCEWQALADAQPLPLQQHWAYGEAAAARDAEVRRAEILGADGRRIGLAQVLLRGPMALLSRGPVWLPAPGAADAAPSGQAGAPPGAAHLAGPAPHASAPLDHAPPDARPAGKPAALSPVPRHAARRSVSPGAEEVQALRLLARSLGWPLIATPEAPLARAGLALVTPRHIAEVDLATGLAARRAAQHGKWRNRLARAETAALTVERLDGQPKAWGWLLKAEAMGRKARGYRALPGDFTNALEAAAPGSVTLWQARAGTGTGTGAGPVAAMLFVRHGCAASYHLGWSGDEGRGANAHNLILWRAMADLADAGVRLLDLGALDTETAPGLARFKLGAGARPRQLGATLMVMPALGRAAAGRQGGGAGRGKAS